MSQQITIFAATRQHATVQFAPKKTKTPDTARRFLESFYQPPDALENVLRHLCDDSAKHRVFLHGAPGIGKTALAEAMHARCGEVRTLGWHVSLCVCYFRGRPSLMKVACGGRRLLTAPLVFLLSRKHSTGAYQIVGEVTEIQQVKFWQLLVILDPVLPEKTPKWASENENFLLSWFESPLHILHIFNQ